jgi:hypothetical protein
MWEILNEITETKKGECKIESIKVENVTITDQKSIAEEFNKFFAGIGTKISESISPTNIDPITLLPDYTVNQNLSFGQLQEADFISLINAMKPKSSSDISGISTKMLKLLKFELSVPLTHLFNLSLSSGKFPSKLKTSRTVPIFKNGDKLLCDKYRPISLLSAISKILEKFVAKKLADHLGDCTKINMAS